MNETGKASFLFGKQHRCTIGRVADEAHNLPGEIKGLVTAVSGAKHEQRISKASYAETNPSRPLGTFGLLGQRKA